MSGKCIITIS